IVSATSNQTIQLAEINDGTCSTVLSNTETVIVNPNPILTSLTSNSPICSGNDAEFTLVGTANATVSYTINGGTTQTVVLDGPDDLMVTIVSATSNQTIQLAEINDGTCSTVLSNTETVIVNPNPILTSLTSNSPICSGNDAEFILAGTPNATVSYTINGGTTQTVVLDGTGNGMVTIVSATSNQTIQLTEIHDGTCSTVLSNTETVIVNPNPILTSLTSNSPICSGSDAEFTLVGTANATVSYTINGGTTQTVVLDGSGNGIVTIVSATSNQTIQLTEINDRTCSTVLNNTETVIVNPNPILTSLTSNSPICSGNDAEFILAGTPNATV